jgi:hypothetical protein
MIYPVLLNDFSVSKTTCRCYAAPAMTRKQKQKKMEYLPFKITEYNEGGPDFTLSLKPDTGTLWVRVGKLDVEIKQTDDGLGVIIETFDAELCEQELGSLQIWYDDIEELPLNEDGTNPLNP